MKWFMIAFCLTNGWGGCGDTRLQGVWHTFETQDECMQAIPAEIDRGVDAAVMCISGMRLEHQ